MEWNLSLIYKSNEEYESDILKLEEVVKEIESLKGALNTLEGFNRYNELNNCVESLISRLYCYTSMKHDLNQKDLKNSEDYSKIYSKYLEVLSRLSWCEPEIISAGKDLILSYCNDKNRFNYEKLFRMNNYIKSEEAEGLMSNYNQVVSGYSNLYDKLIVVDNNSRKVKLSTGETITVNNSNYRYYLSILENQNDRRKVFEAIFKYYDLHKATIAEIYNGIMQGELADVKNRGYKNILESKLYMNNIDPQVFHSLIEVARNYNAPLLKYFDIRKKYFNLKTYHTYDRFLSFKESNVKYSYAESKALILDAMKILGEDFYNKACKVLEDGRVSVEIKDGKQGGAYSTGTYENGPFILLNHSNTIDDAFTIAHEAGHSIHTLYANENQPIETANYVIFVAEVASTFNEQLFLDYMIEKSDDKNEKIVLLQQAIDGLVGTFYRQTLFADYEYQAHQLVENNIPVTQDALCKIMEDLYMKYYGINLKKEKYKNMVWAYIPHLFGSPFYVYQYATSYSASLAIYQKVKNKEEGAFEAYIELLKSGGSDYPVNLIKKAGVDLTTKEPFIAVVERMSELVDQLEKILGE